MGRFDFKQFTVDDSQCAMKVGTDAVILGCWVSIPEDAQILDAGCGCGILALMMAQRSAKSKILAVDIDEKACEDARNNVANSPWIDRVEVVCADLTTRTPALESPKLIISNPPFFKETLRSSDRSRALARHGESFDVLKLIDLCEPYLSSASDSVAFIAPAERDEEIEFYLSLKKLDVNRKMYVKSKEGRPPYRILWQVGRQLSSPTEIAELVIRNSDGMYTSQYVDLTSEFYTHLNP